MNLNFTVQHSTVQYSAVQCSPCTSKHCKCQWHCSFETFGCQIETEDSLKIEEAIL